MLLVATACCTQELPRDSRTPDTNAALLGKTDAKGLWQYLLDCAERHTPQCRAQVERVAARTSQIEAVGRLATVLLQEWELEPMHASLLRARRVWIPFPDSEEVRDLLPSQFDAPIIVLSGVVLPDGRVKDAILMRASNYPELNARVLCAFSRGLYRPAWATEGFVSQRVEFLYRLEPRE
jgi:hypothetical protein